VFLRWLDFNGYTIVETGTGEATLAPKLGEGSAAAQGTLSDATVRLSLGGKTIALDLP